MNSLKTMLMIAVLVVIAYSAYVSINSKPTEMPAEIGEDWPSGPPQVSLPGTVDGGVAPSFAMGGPNELPPPGVPPLPSRSNELSPPRPFSERAPAPPFSAAPMPPEIASDLNAPTPAAMTDASAVGSRAPMPPLAGPNDSGFASTPPTPAIDPGMAPPLPTDVSAYGMSQPGSPNSTEIRADFAKFLSDARRDLEQGRFRETLGILSSRYGEPDQTPAEAAALTELLDQVAGTVIYSTEHLLEPAYVVQPGETLPQIAKKYDVPMELLAKINAIPDPMSLRAGQELKIVRGPFHAVVKLEAHEMDLWLQDLYAGRFAIGVGTDASNLEGSFMVREKNREPAYYGPNGQGIGPNDPLNPLGKRRIGLGDAVAIHGTNNPETIGQTGGPGAVRLGDRDVEDVFDILSLGSRIVIRR